MTSAIQLIGIMFCVLMTYITYFNYRRTTLKKEDFIFWSIIWLSGLLLLSNYEIINKTLATMEIIRVMDLITIVTAVLFSSIIFLLYSKMRETEKKMTQLIQELALNNHEKHNNTRNK